MCAGESQQNAIFNSYSTKKGGSTHTHTNAHMAFPYEPLLGEMDGKKTTTLTVNYFTVYY